MIPNTSPRRSGAAKTADEVRWRVWAPKATRVVLSFPESDRGQVEMRREGDGVYSVTLGGIAEGTRYAYLLDGGRARADPCSLWQPAGADGPSAVVFPESFPWSDQQWKGVPREELVFYELHVGTFTEAGTFAAVIPRLAALKDLGITAIELMPVGQFSGARNWGYDGVLPYAAQHSYGGPHALQKLVDAAHAAGLAIFLDVVYNHFGPEHSYLGEFGHYFNDRYKTPWGSAINFDGRGSDVVRDFVLDNVRMWLEEFHFDGVRLDAVHAMYDLGATHILRAIAQVAEDVGRRTGRRRYAVGESDLNDPRVVRGSDVGGYGLDAQWSDDFHHAIHACLTGETRGYYQDYGTREHLAKVMVDPFVYAGDFSKSRGRKHGAKPAGISGNQFIVCLQNHDQVGNRARGERLTSLLSGPAEIRLAACLLLFAPYVPLLFMGEEYAEQRPFPFFCSFCGQELIESVRAGRKREFADFVENADEIPMPDAEETFASARLSWSWPEGSVFAGVRSLYQDLLRARREWPGLKDFVNRTSRLLPERSNGQVLELVRGTEGSAITAYFNLTGEPAELPSSPPTGNSGVVFSSELGRYAGNRSSLADAHNLLPFECVALSSGGKSVL